MTHATKLPPSLALLLAVVWLGALPAPLPAAHVPVADAAAAASEGADETIAPFEPVPRPDAPQMELDLSSPRATLLTTYFPAINRIQRREGDLDEAWAHVLATMQWEDVVDQAAAREAALHLLEVFDRLGRVDADQLPDEADLRDTSIGRFVFFPQPDQHARVWEALRDFGLWPDGQIVLERTDGGWQFSADTVAGAAALRESMAPLPPRHLAPQHERDITDQFARFLGPTFRDTPWWGWVVLFAAILLGLAAGKIASGTLRRVAARIDERGWPARALLLQDAANPASLALFGVGLGFGLEALTLTEDLKEFRAQVLTFLYLFALGWFLFNIVNIIEISLRRYTEGTGRLDEIVVTLIRRALRIFLVVMFTLVVAQNVFGLNIAAWLAGFGLVGLGISLAAQDSIRNLFGSVTVFLDKPFRVGDFIEFDGQRGGIESIGFRSTRMRLLSGHVLTIPNSRFIESSVENITARPSIRRVMNVSVTYDTATEKLDEAVRIVKEVLHDEDVVAEGRFDMKDWPPRVAFDEMRSDNLNITAFYWYQIAGDPDRGWFTYMNHAQMVNLKLIERFRAAGIDFAFPTQTLYLAGDPDRQLAVRMLQDQ